MDKREIEGSPERAADRGRQEDLGWPESARPSLGDPAVVRGLVQDFATEVIGVRADYNGDKLTGQQAQDAIRAAAVRYGGIFMGRDGKFEALPWNDPARLGQRILLSAGSVDGVDDPGEALFLILSRSLTDIAVAHEDGRLSDPAAKQNLKDALDSVVDLLLGYK